MFPVEVVSIITSYLDATTQFHVARCVCRLWYHAVATHKGFWLRVGKIQTAGLVRQGQTNSNTGSMDTRRRTFSLHLKGFAKREILQEHVSQSSVSSKSCCDDEGNQQSTTTDATTTTSRKRTRGHLPEPCMVFRDDAEQSIAVATTVDLEHHIGCSSVILFNTQRLESVKDRLFVAVDIPASHLIVVDVEQDINNNVASSQEEHKTRQWSLKKYVQATNFSHCSYLQQISVRGCSNLKYISMPPTLLALDVSGCTNLEQIHIPIIAETTCPATSTNSNKSSTTALQPIQSLNLHGCRSLRILGGSTFSSTRMKEWVSNLHEMDLSSCHQLSPEFVTNMLQATTCLQSLSLRYIATDEILQALAQSPSNTRLRWVDVAFCPHVTDKAVMTLLDQSSSSSLERLNLRGCTNISSYCYNNTPIVLQQRKQQQRQQQQQQQVSTQELQQIATNPLSTQHARKGDNLFFFVSSLEEQKKQRAAKKRK